MSDPKIPNLLERIQYLVVRRFPFASTMNFPTSLSSSRNRLPGPTGEDRQAVSKYRAELAALSWEDLVACYNAEKQREYDQLVAKTELEERQRFFNQPHVAADFVHWSKMAHWTLDEAVALSFGKAPELVSWPTISKYLQLSRFAVQYQRRREIATRAVQWKQLFDPVLPGIFLAWAQRMEIIVPLGLLDAVSKRDRIADWKSMYDDAKAAHQEQEKVWREIVRAKDESLAELERRVRQLEAEQTPAATEKPLGAKERDSLLKIVVGMALDSYKYDPKLSRSTVPQEITDDLAKHGIVLDVDTVRKWLKLAAEFLPPQ